MGIIIKHYKALTKDQLYECLKLRNEVFVVEQKCPYLDIDGKDEDAFHLMVMKSDELIGYLRLLKPGVTYEEASIGRVLIAQTARKKGLGREMMTAGVDYIINEFKGDVIRISAQLYLKDFYESLGFERVSKDYLEDDIPHLEMLYRLDSF